MTFDRCAAETFLAEPHVAVLAVAAAGPPAAVPLWYGYAPGGELWIVTPAGSRKAGLLRSAGYATLVVEEVAPRTRYVSVELRLLEARAVTEGERRELASRYLGGDQLYRYLTFAREHLRGEHRISFRPTRWRFADLTP